MVVLDAEELCDEVCQAHCAQEMMQAKLLYESFLSLSERLITSDAISVPLVSLTTAAYMLQEPCPIKLSVGVPALGSCCQSLHKGLVRFFLRLRDRCVWTIQGASVDSPDQRVLKLEVLVPIEHERNYDP